MVMVELRLLIVQIIDIPNKVMPELVVPITLLAVLHKTESLRVVTMEGLVRILLGQDQVVLFVHQVLQEHDLLHLVEEEALQVVVEALPEEADLLVEVDLHMEVRPIHHTDKNLNFI